MLGGQALCHLFERLGTATDGQDVQAAPGEGLDPGGTKALRGPSDDSPRPLWQVSTERGHMGHTLSRASRPAQSIPRAQQHSAPNRSI
jgi:hypothetical protein